MNILYLHGLMSSNQSPKADWLRSKGCTVYSPKLNYKEDGKTIFNDLELLCEKEHIALIVGSSMGGHLAFHLGNKYDIPTLLFNPSLAPNEIDKPDVREVENDIVLHTVVIGKNDDVVIPQKTLNFLKDRKVNFIHYFEDNGHRTPLSLFQKHFSLLIETKNTI